MTALALNILETYRFNTNIDIPDAFIAATAIVKKQKLLTKNIKHFQDLSNLKVELLY